MHIYCEKKKCLTSFTIKVFELNDVFNYEIADNEADLLKESGVIMQYILTVLTLNTPYCTDKYTNKNFLFIQLDNLKWK